MKLKQIIFIFSLLLVKVYRQQIKRCKSIILSSLDFTGRLTPNHHSSLCPDVDLNCCTNHDQMKMHKLWTDVSKLDLFKHYENFNEAFKKLKQIISSKEQINLMILTEKFKKSTEVAPSNSLYKHLKEIAGKYALNDATYLFDTLEDLTKKRFPVLHETLIQLRGGSLCGYCDWEYHNFINVDSLTLIYRDDFCFKLVQQFLDIYDKKYSIIETFLMLDEWMYLTIDKRLIPAATDRAIFRRYFKIIDQCKEKKSDISACADFCREFNINRFTYMFDGEEDILNEMVLNYEEFYKASLNTKRLFRTINQITEDKFIFYQKNHSILSSVPLVDPMSKNMKKNDFNLNFAPQNVNSIFEKLHDTNEIEIETLDNEISSYNLYKRQDEPFDFSRFLILFESTRGIDLYESSKKTNLDISAEKFLAMIHLKKNKTNELDEIIEDHIKKVLLDIKINTFADWINDLKMKFKKVNNDLSYRAEILDNHRKATKGMGSFIKFILRLIGFN